MLSLFEYRFLFEQPGKGVITKGVFSLQESLESLNSPENGRLLLVFQSLGTLDFLGSLE